LRRLRKPADSDIGDGVRLEGPRSAPLMLCVAASCDFSICGKMLLSRGTAVRRVDTQHAARGMKRLGRGARVRVVGKRCRFDAVGDLAVQLDLQSVLRLPPVVIQSVPVLPLQPASSRR